MSMSRLAQVFRCALLGAVAAGLVAPAAAAAAPTYVDGVVLVGYRASAPTLARATTRAAVGVMAAQPLSRSDRNAEKLQFKAGTNIDAVIKQLLLDPNVRYAHPDYHINPVLNPPNDPSFANGTLWGMLGDASTPANTYGSQAAEVWSQGFVGSQQVVVGVIDEGIQVNHPDLRDNIWVNPYETAANGIDDDGNGFIDDVNGWDFFNNDATVYDGTADAHGTHVSGTIGGKGNNGQGVVGVNWDVAIISAKFLGPTGGSTSDAVRALDYLTDLKLRHGINLVATNNSWGGGGFSQALLDAINRAGDAGILFIAAAGNNASNNDTTANYPSNYQCVTAARPWDCVVAVASITSTGALSSFSDYGATTVDLGAPGSAITSTVPDSTYASYDGTSMATPHVTGAVALCASVDQTLSAQELRAAVVGSTAPTAALAGKTLTGGRLDAGAMFPACRPPATTVSGAPSNLAGTASGSTAIRLTWTEGVSGESYYEVERGDATCSTFVKIAEIGAGAASYTATGLQADTTYCFQVRAGNRYPSFSAYSNTATVATAPAPQPYQCSVTPYAWQDISTSASLGLGDDAETVVSLPFTWYFHGVPVTSLKVGSNGLIRVDGGSALSYTNVGIPSAVEPNGFIAPFWDDLNPSIAGAAVRTAVLGTAPNRRVVVSWDAVPHFSASTNPLSFQVVLEEGNSNVVMNYRDVLTGSALYDRGREASVGIESAVGDFGTQVAYNTASLTDGTALRCANAPSATVVPGTPGGLAAAATSGTTVTVSWTDGVNESGYALERATGAGTFAVIATLGANATSYADTQLTAGTAYNYRLRAFNAAGNSGNSATASVTTTAVGLPAPTGFAVGTVTATSIALSWNAVIGATSYTLEWSTTGTGAWTALAAQTTRTYTHTGRANNTTYYYRLKANGTAGSSPYTAVLSAKTLTALPTAPNNLRATRSGANVTVTWGDRSNNETGFDIGRATQTGGVWSATTVVGTVGANVVRFTQAPGTGAYRYYVRSKTATNASAWVGPSTTVTVP